MTLARPRGCSTATRPIAARSAIAVRARAFLAGLAEAARDAGELLLLVAFARGEPVAGVMLIRHGISATYEVGHVTPEGRRLRATHLLLWRGIERLHVEDGVDWLDLGGVATDRSPGIARFKLGMGGEVAILPGTFLCSRIALRPPGIVADGLLIRFPLLVAPEPVGDLVPGGSGVVERLLRRLAPTHCRGELLVQDRPILGRAADPQIGQHGRRVECRWKAVRYSCTSALSQPALI